NIMLVLLGTTSGFGTMFAFLISAQLRAYNRISIFIAYVCILAFALSIDCLYKHHVKNNKRRALRYVFAGACSVLCIFSLYEGFPEGEIPDYETNSVNYYSDAEFVQRIEAEVPEASSIFQLPYHEYPEGGPVNDMNDYHLYVGYIHSDKLKWSYGGIKGRNGDSWNRNAAALEPADMVAELKKAGFSGIYIDKRAYTGEEYKQLEGKLKEITGQDFIYSDNGALSFIKF
ncbi:MAG: hypothetical protein Q4F11_03055, partial [Eubacteriales bacterium]|nr:hypothetical protein [Eubacteriales bacterium]